MIHPRSCNAKPNFYPRSPCGERLFLLRKITITVDISIHALLAESDPLCLCGFSAGRISIHALLAESDKISPHSAPDNGNFYPRSPCGERQQTNGKKHTIKNFYPRSPCGERHNIPPDSVLIIDISIHALLAESDSVFIVTIIKKLCISIHALLAESDGCGYKYVGDCNISIHALLAESDPKQYELKLCFYLFLSTLSLRRATVSANATHVSSFISIHALLAESDYPMLLMCLC